MGRLIETEQEGRYGKAIVSEEEKHFLSTESVVKIRSVVIYRQLLLGIAALKQYPLLARASEKYNMTFPVYRLESIDNVGRRK